MSVHGLDSGIRQGQCACGFEHVCDRTLRAVCQNGMRLDRIHFINLLPGFALAAAWLRRKLAIQRFSAAAAERVALPGRGSTAFGSKKVSQGAVSAGALFSPLNQRL